MNDRMNDRTSNRMSENVGTSALRMRGMVHVDRKVS